MHDNFLIFSLFLIFAGATVLSTIALYTRQSLLVAYMLLGILLGPWGLKWIGNAAVIKEIGDVGILFLLFLLGLHLQPQTLLHTLKKVSWVTLVSSVVFGGIGFGFAHYLKFNLNESLVVGCAAMFSSTIIGLKLLPTTVLHHQHTGEVMIGILLLQDLIAIFALIVLHSVRFGDFSWIRLVYILFFIPALLGFCFLSERYILRKLFRKFDRIREYMFLLAIAWCLSVSMLATLTGLSAEIGAFIAGVSIANSPIAAYIAESLKPIRDFFLVLFFFAVGASFNLDYFQEIAVPSLILAGILMLAKPLVFRALLTQVGESKHVAWEVGCRLGQVSEFSILLAYVGLQEKMIGSVSANLIQTVTMLTFIVSSYFVVLKYPTPVALSDKLRRD